MNNLIAIASIAALSAAQSDDYYIGIPGNLNSLHDNASHAMTDAIEADHHLMEQLIQEVQMLRGQLERQGEDLERLDLELKEAELDIALLNDEQVVEEHFFTNDEFVITNVAGQDPYHCMPEIVVPAGKTLDMSAVYSSTWHEHAGTYAGSLFLMKQGETMAWHRH